MYTNIVMRNLLSSFPPGADQLFENDARFEFVVHEHRATGHHYDFNIRIGEQFITWAIPKGPSMDHRISRSMVFTGWHSAQYIYKERFIPAGQKGSGPKMVWDRGSYSFSGKSYQDVVNALTSGRFMFTLLGSKLKGTWLIKQPESGDTQLCKLDDEYASAQDICREDRSVISHLRLRDFEVGPAAYVELPGFYAQLHPQEQPVVILRDGYVLDVNERAASLSVNSGMPERMARNLVQDGEFIAWQEEAYTSLQHEWLDLCLAYTDCIEPKDQHSAYLDFHLHPAPIDVLSELKQRLQNAIDLVPRVGLARAKWLAELSAHRNGGLAAYENPSAFLAALSVECLYPVPSDQRLKLKSLGHPTIGRVRGLNQDQLFRQFGRDGFRIHQAARGYYQEPIRPQYPKDALMARFQFPGGVESWETILAGCEVLAKQLGQKLRQRDLEGTQVRIYAEFDESRAEVFTRIFAKPVKCARSVLAALIPILKGQIQSPLISLRVLLPELNKVQAQQLNLFAIDKQEKAILPTLQKVQKAFGENSVVLASERTERRRVRVLRSWKHATGWH